MAKKTSKKKVAKTPPKVLAENPMRHLKLIQVRMIDLQAHLEIHDQAIPDKADIRLDSEVGIPDESHLHVNGTIYVEARPSESQDGETSICQIMVRFQTVFAVSEVPPESLEDSFREVAKTGMMVMWPQFRETVMSATSKMGLKPLTLPLIFQGEVGERIMPDPVKSKRKSSRRPKEIKPK